jgi:hypothetical protein
MASSLRKNGSFRFRRTHMVLHYAKTVLPLLRSAIDKNVRTYRGLSDLDWGLLGIRDSCKSNFFYTFNHL